MSANLDKKMLNGLSREIRDYLPCIREGIQRFQNDTTKNEILDDTLRYIHTIKGASALMGLMALSQIASYMEEILEGIISGQNSFDTMRQQWLSMTIEQIDPYLEDLLKGEGENQEIVGLIESGYFEIVPGSNCQMEEDNVQIANELGGYGENEATSESSRDNQTADIDLNDREQECEDSETVYINHDDRDSSWCDNTTSAEELLNDASTTDLDKDEAAIVARDLEISNDEQEEYGNNDDENLEEYQIISSTDGIKDSDSLDIGCSEEISEEYGNRDVVDGDPAITEIDKNESNQADSHEYVDPTESFFESVNNSCQNSNIDTNLYSDLADEDKSNCEKSDESIVSGNAYGLSIDVSTDEIQVDPSNRDRVYDTQSDNTQEFTEVVSEIRNEDSQYANFAEEEPSTLRSYEETVPEHDTDSEDNVKTSNHLEKIIGQIDEQIKNIYETVDQASFRPSHLLSLDHNQRHLLFTVGQSHYAATVDNILEIGQVPSITPVPNVPNWLRGVINLRGEILSVIDLRGFFDDRSSVKSDDERLVVVRTEDGSVMTSFFVDQINGFALLENVLNNDVSDIFQDKATPYLSGIFEFNGMIFSALDIESLLRSTEINQFY